MQKVKVVWRSQAETHTNGWCVCPRRGHPAKMSKRQNPEHERNGSNTMQIAFVGFAKLPSPTVLPRDAFTVWRFPASPNLQLWAFPSFLHLVKFRGNLLNCARHTHAPIVSTASTIKPVTQLKPPSIGLKDWLLST